MEILPVTGVPEVRPGDDLAILVADRADLRTGDVLVVAQKIVSKAEGRLVPGGGATAGACRAAGHDARRRLARAESRRIVADTPWVLVTETPHGFVCANGGVDASNAPAGMLVLLPVDPDASARRLRHDLQARTGKRLGVIVADTFGRPWRLGQTDIAIGVAGLEPLRDERGATDREGRTLEVTEPAVADALAAAADLVRRKGEGIPVVVVRGYDGVSDADGPGAAALVRSAGEDLFRRGAGLLATELARTPRTRPQPATEPVPGWVVDRVLEIARAHGAEPRLLGTGATRIAVEAADDLAAGAVAGLLVAALVEAGAVARHRLPGTGEPGQVVVEAGWGVEGDRR